MEDLNEIWDAVHRVEQNIKELEQSNKDRTEELFEQIMEWVIDKVKNSKHINANVLCLDIFYDCCYGKDRFLELYVGNCHSFDDWKGACFSVEGEYGRNRNSENLHKFVVENWQKVKQTIIDKIVESQMKYAKRQLKDYEEESEYAKTLDAFVL